MVGPTIFLILQLIEELGNLPMVTDLECDRVQVLAQAVWLLTPPCLSSPAVAERWQIHQQLRGDLEREAVLVRRLPPVKSLRQKYECKFHSLKP